MNHTVSCCLIRHGMTFGNTKKRYIGVTDEPLCREGRERLLERKKAGWYPPAELVLTSPLLRCRQTAELLYPGQEQILLPGFAETDFGLFENKSYEELKDEPAYQAFLDSMGALPFPGGESSEQVRDRVCRQMAEAAALLSQAETAAFVVHGGTIMTLLSQYGRPQKGFYDWQVKNGEGYLVALCPEEWDQNPLLQVVSPLGNPAGKDGR